MHKKTYFISSRRYWALIFHSLVISLLKLAFVFVRRKTILFVKLRSLRSSAISCAFSVFFLQSEESLSSEGSATSGGSSATTEDSGSEMACDITLIERLIRSHPIWFLPGIQRAGAFHLLQGKEEGVRKCTWRSYIARSRSPGVHSLKGK